MALKEKKILSAEKKQKIKKLLENFREKMKKIDSRKKGIEKSGINFTFTAKKTRILLEEIHVPALEILKQKK